MIDNVYLIFLRNIAISLAFTILIGSAASEKWRSLKTPDWFLKQFENTFIAKLPGGVSFGYWKIATLEALLTLAFIVSIFLPSLLPLALVGAMFLFCALLFGLRVSFDYQGSANMFVYFLTALASFYWVTQ